MIRTKIFKVTFAPHIGAENAVQAKFDEIEDGGGAVISVNIENSTAYIIARVQTATQEQADKMVQSGEASLPAEGISADAEAQPEVPSKKKKAKG